MLRNGGPASPESAPLTMTYMAMQPTAAPLRQIRAVFDEATVRVYQAYKNSIADAALNRGTFVSPPFKMDRMTWIKPSYLWMMYRSGWGLKDSGQARILAIDITRAGFEWALAHSCLSNHGMQTGTNTSLGTTRANPVRVQWDPERDLLSRPLAHRAIQIGLGGEAVERYVSEWIRNITDMTVISRAIFDLIHRNRIDEARTKIPTELPYPLDPIIEARINPTGHS